MTLFSRLNKNERPKAKLEAIWEQISKFTD